MEVFAICCLFLAVSAFLVILGIYVRSTNQERKKVAARRDHVAHQIECIAVTLAKMCDK